MFRHHSRSRGSSRARIRSLRGHVPFWLLLAAALFGASDAALATDKELLDVLLANDAITQEQYNDLLAKEKLTREDVDKVVVTLNEHGFRARSADGDFEIKIGARLHAQASTHVADLSSGNGADDGVELRRARLELSGRFYRDWLWAAESDFADNEVSVKDFWLGYQPADWARVTMGHQKQPYSLSLEMSSNDIPFIERGVDNDLNAPFVDRAIGLRTDLWGERWFLAAGFFGESVEPDKDDDEGMGAAARFVVAPVLNDHHVLHVGARAAWREPSDSNKSLRVRTETTHMSDLNVVDTGTVEGVDSTTLFGPEVAWAYGPFSCFGEYSQAYVDRGVGPDLWLHSWHAAAALSLTGETLATAYRIDAGEFKRLRPAENFSWSEGTWGAWESAARVAGIDANSGDVLGGAETVLTTALNWYVNDSIRFMAEWSHILDTDRSSQLRREAEDMEIFQFRSQFTF